MNYEIYAPNIHLFAFNLYKTPNAVSNSVAQKAENIWIKCNEVLQKLNIEQKLTLRTDNPEGMRVDMLETAKNNGRFLLDLQGHIRLDQPDEIVNITGIAYPLRIQDTYALALNIRCPEQENGKRTHEISLAILRKLNYGKCLLPNFINSTLGQTIVITGWLNEQQKAQADKFFKNIADECIKEFTGDSDAYKDFYKQGNLFGSPIFEYGLVRQPGIYCHIIVWLFCDPVTEKQFTEDCYHEFIDLFCYRNKIITVFQESRNTYSNIYKKFENIERIINEIFGNDELENSGTKNYIQLELLKQYMQKLPRIALEYTRLLRLLEFQRNTIAINTRNYQKTIGQICAKLESDPEYSLKPIDLSFLKAFSQDNCQYYQQQIQSDLNYFMQGSGLLEKAIASIRGIVEIEQAEIDRESLKELRAKDESDKERDRNLQTTIGVVGTGLAAGAIVTSGSDQLPDKLPVPFTNYSLYPFTVTIILGFGAALIFGGATWKILSLLQCLRDKSKKFHQQNINAFIKLLKNQSTLFSSQDVTELRKLIKIWPEEVESLSKRITAWCQSKDRFHICEELRVLRKLPVESESTTDRRYYYSRPNSQDGKEYKKMLEDAILQSLPGSTSLPSKPS
ncbi:hypothetical protein NIES4073_46070 [Kalymmatonema gypsitolerans NIES-4073]|nr:hypothetical protein NIES4073_46070 [Scytonema sp. NIES-4073]